MAIGWLFSILRMIFSNRFVSKIPHQNWLCGLLTRSKNSKKLLFLLGLFRFSVSSISACWLKSLLMTGSLCVPFAIRGSCIACFRLLIEFLISLSCSGDLYACDVLSKSKRSSYSLGWSDLVISMGLEELFIVIDLPAIFRSLDCQPITSSVSCMKRFFSLVRVM